MKKMLSAAYDKLALSHASVCYWYKFKSNTKSVELIGRPFITKTALTKQSTLAQP